MSANLSRRHWGQGVAWAAPDGGRGSAATEAALISEDRLAELLGKDAKEAVASLDGDFAAGKLPELAEVIFPGPIAEAMYWSNDAVIGIQGPVGSGKTTTVMKSRLRRAIEMPRSAIDGVRRYKVLFIRETYRQLWSTTIPSYLETFPKDLGDWAGGRGDPVTHVIRFEDAHGPIEFRAEFMAFGDNIIASMRGVQTTDIVLNEMDTMPDDVLMVGIGRIDRHPARDHFKGYPAHQRSYGQIVGDFNAPDEDNWTFRVFHDEAARARISEEMTGTLEQGAGEIRIAFFNQPGFGEPGCENMQNLSPTYYQKQIMSMRMAGRGDMIDRLVYNKITYLRAGDPVFKREFNRRIHVSDGPLEVIRGVPLQLGFDQGFKGAAVIGQFIEPFHWRIYAELHFPRERLMAREFGRRLSILLQERFANIPIEAGWGDMAGEAGASQAADENDTWNLLVARTAGIPIRAQRVGTNRIQPRLEAVRAVLEFIHGGQPGLVLDPGCKFLIAGCEARYVWTDQVGPDGDKRKVPDKSLTEANVMDALQYLLLSKHRWDGTSPISNIGPGAHLPNRPGHPPKAARPGGPGGLTTGFDVLNPYGGPQ